MQTSPTEPAPTGHDQTERLLQLSVWIVFRDLPYVESMMQAGGHPTFDHLLLSALYSYSQHLECGVPTTAFDLARNRKLGGRRRQG